MIDIHTTHIGEVTVIHVAGRLDAINVPQFSQTIDHVLENNSNKLVLHMREVNYLSAAGLRVLKTLKERSEHVRIAEPSDRVVDVMQITGLDAVYELHSTLTDALYSVRPVLNAHTHLELGWLKAGLPDVAGMDFTRWIRSAIYQPFQNLKPDWQEQFTASIESGIQELKAAGITTVGDISETGLSIQPLLNAGMHGIVYIEVSGHDPTQAEARFQKMVEIVNTWRYKMRGRLKLGLAPHTPWSVSRELWKKVLDYAKKENLPLCIHVAESEAEVQFLKDGTGSIKDIYYPHMNFTAPQKTPIAYLEELGALEQKPLLVHAVHVTDEDIALIKKHDCTVVHCPRSNLRLRCGRMPLEKFLEADIPVLLGTDSLASSPSLNVFQELEIAAALHYGKVDPKQLIEMTHGLLPGMIDVS